MNLTDIAKKILSEDSFGNNPSAAGGMSPGREPTATTPPPSQSGNLVDISQSFRNFKLEVENQEEASIKKFEAELKSKFLRKTVTVKASKGGIKQPNAKEYTITINDVDVRYMSDKYYVIFIGTEKNAGQKEYYVDDSQIEVNPVTTSSTESQPSIRNVGGIVPLSPTSAGTPAARNILPQG